MANVEIRQDSNLLGNTDILNINSPLVANISNGIADISANTIKISELPAVPDAFADDIIPIVTNSTSIPVSEHIKVSSLFNNVSVNTNFYSNVSSHSNVSIVNNSVIKIGNDSVNSVHTASFTLISSPVTNTDIKAGVIQIGNTVMNSTFIVVGSNLAVNSSAYSVGNSISNVVVNSVSMTTSNTTSSVRIIPTQLFIGNSTSNSVLTTNSLRLSNSSTNIEITNPTSDQITNGGYYLNANGDWALVDGASAEAGGSNTNIQYNNSNTIAGSNAFNFDNTTNTVIISNTGSFQVGNSTVNTIANTTTVKISNSTVSTQLQSGSLVLGNSTVNTVSNSTTIAISNSTSNLILNSSQLDIGVTVVNSSAVSVGSNSVLTGSGLSVINSASIGNTSIGTNISVGNSVISTTISKGVINISSTGSSFSVNTSYLNLSNSTVTLSITLPTSIQQSTNNVYLHANGSWVAIQPESTPGGEDTQVQFNASGYLAGSNQFTFNSGTGRVNIGNTLFTNNNLLIGNSTVNVAANSTTFAIANSSSNTRLTIPTASQYTGNAFFLHANGSWINVETVISLTGTLQAAGSNTQVQYNNSGAAGASAAFTFNNASNNVTVANTLTAKTLYAENGTLLVGNSTVNTFANSTTIRLANSTSNTRVTIPTAAQYAGETFFLHANGSWVNVETVYIGRAVGDEGTIQYAAANGSQTGNSNVRIVGNTSIVISNTSSNARITIPTTDQWSSGQHVLNANGSWSNVVKIVADAGVGVPGGSNTHVQFNNSGVFGGTSGFKFDKDTDTLTVERSVVVGSLNATVVSTCTSIVVSNSTSNTSIFSNRVRTGISELNSTSISVGSNVNINASSLLITNINSNVNIGATSVNLANTSSNTRLTIPTVAQYAGNAFFLHANGSWINVETVISLSGSIGGTNTQVIFNDSGSSNGSSGFIFNKITNSASIGNTISIGTGSPVVISNNRIRGDFSTGSYASPSGFAQRVTFQSSTLAQTQVQAMPGNISSSSRQASYIAYNGDPSNSSFIATASIPEYTFIESGRTGTSSYLPLYIWSNNAPRYVFRGDSVFGVSGGDQRGGHIYLKYRGEGLYPLSGTNSWNMEVYGTGGNPNHLRIYNYDAGANQHMAMMCSDPTGPSLSVPANTIFAPRSATIGQIPFHLCVEGDMGPYAGGTYDLGSGLRRWKEVFTISPVNVASDIRYKENVNETDLGLDFINKLNPVSYNLKEEHIELKQSTDENGDVISEYVVNDSKEKTLHYGLIAQEVKETLNNIGVNNFGGWVVDEQDPDKKQSLRYEEFISPMIKAIQELSKEVAALKEKINKLENE